MGGHLSPRPHPHHSTTKAADRSVNKYSIMSLSGNSPHNSRKYSKKKNPESNNYYRIPENAVKYYKLPSFTVSSIAVLDNESFTRVQNGSLKSSLVALALSLATCNIKSISCFSTNSIQFGLDQGYNMVHLNFLGLGLNLVEGVGMWMFFFWQY